MGEKLVITGATGLFGANFVYTALAAGWSPVGVAWPCRLQSPLVPIHEVDLRVASAVQSFLQEQRPVMVVHLAALTNVDWCEDHAADTYAMNTDVSGRLAAAARAVGARFIYMSTDSVFDGERGGYVETDVPAPRNVYASSKLAGEQAVLLAHPEALVVRSNIFGWNAQSKTNLADWIVASLRAGKPIMGFTDMIFAPLLVTTLSQLMLDLAQTRAAGIWHLASAAPITKYDFACAMARHFALPQDLIRAAVSDVVAQRAVRPRNTWLDARAAAQRLARPLPVLEDMLAEFRRQESDGYAQRLRATLGGAAA